MKTLIMTHVLANLVLEGTEDGRCAASGPGQHAGVAAMLIERGLRPRRNASRPMRRSRWPVTNSAVERLGIC